MAEGTLIKLLYNESLKFQGMALVKVIFDQAGQTEVMGYQLASNEKPWVKLDSNLNKGYVLAITNQCQQAPNKEPPIKIFDQEVWPGESFIQIRPDLDANRLNFGAEIQEK